MYLPQHHIIFIHIPKTAGNYIQAQFVKLGLTNDRIRALGHQDGRDRFEVRGEYTRSKHQTVEEYRNIMGPLFQNCRIMACVRNPIDRALSMFFSPHRGMRRGLLRWRYVPPVFTYEAFEEVVAEMPSMSVLLGGAMPDILIRYETLNTDLEDAFQLLDARPPENGRVNASYIAWDHLKGDARVAQIVAAHHAQDFESFSY